MVDNSGTAKDMEANIIVESPPISTSQNQYAALLDNYERKPDIFLLLKKEKVLVDKLVNSKNDTYY